MIRDGRYIGSMSGQIRENRKTQLGSAIEGHATAAADFGTKKKSHGGARGRTWTDGQAFALLDSFGIDKVCECVTAGFSMRKIAEQAGVSTNAMWRWLLADLTRSARAKAARALTAWHWDEQAEEVINSATDALELTKARELAHHYRWRASKIAPKEYGDRLEHAGSIDMNVGLADRLEAARQRVLAAAAGGAVIEGMAEAALVQPSALSTAADDERELGDQ